MVSFLQINLLSYPISTAIMWNGQCRKEEFIMFESLKQAYLPETDFPRRKINADKCIRCGRCYETCPAFGFKWEKGEIPQPIGYGGLKEACLNCGNCTAVCRQMRSKLREVIVSPPEGIRRSFKERGMFRILCQGLCFAVCRRW